MQRQRAEGPPLAAAILSVGKERSSAESSGVLVRGHPATDVQTVETVSLRRWRECRAPYEPDHCWCFTNTIENNLMDKIIRILQMRNQGL